MLRRNLAWLLASFACLAVTLPIAACGPSSSSAQRDQGTVSAEQDATSGQPEGPTIAIGVAADQPGFGVWRNGGYSGFDVDVARYVANALGYADKQIVFKQVTPSTRVDMLNNATVQMVVSSFNVTDVHRNEVAMTGPYLVVHQDLLIRADEVGAITGLDDMSGRTACVVSGSDVADSIRSQASDVTIELRDNYDQCVTSLMVGSSDAIAAGDAILTGLASAKGNGYLHVVGNPFGREHYGIAVKKGSTKLAENIAGILDTMIRDGSWDDARTRLYDSIGYLSDSSLNPPDPTYGVV